MILIIIQQNQRRDLSGICSQGGVGRSCKAVKTDIGIGGVDVDNDAEELARCKIHQEPDGQGNGCNRNKQLK